MQVEIEAVCGPKFLTFRDDIGNASWLSTHLNIVYIVFRSEEAVKLPLSCEVVQKGFWARFVGEGIPQILDMHF